MSDTTAARTVKGAELLSRARALVPTLHERAAQAEKMRCIPPESIDELRKAGLFRTMQPSIFGGHELPLDDAVLITATVAEGCGSTGWVQGVYSDHCATLGMFDGQAQKDVWGNSPESLISSGFMPTGKAVRVDGGYRLSGRWSFSSGCDYADWALVRTFVPGTAATDPPELYMFLVPRTDYTLIDTWFVMGMNATGSKDFQLNEEVFVPEHRAIRNKDLTDGTGPGSAFNSGALYRLPRMATVPFSLAAPTIGIAERALQTIIQGMAKRSSADRRSSAEGATHARIATSAAEIDSSRALMLQDCRESMETIGRGERLTVEQRGRNRRDIAYVGYQCTRAVDRLFATAGGSNVYLEREAQRLLRDIHTAGQHISLSWDVAATTYGRIAFGLPPGQEV